MNRYRVLEHVVGGACVHHVENAVDGFVAAGAENGGAQDLTGLGIHDGLHQPLRLALFDGAAHFAHRAATDEDRVPGGACLCFGQADATERRVDVESIGADAIAQPAVAAVEQVGRDDLEVVVRRVGECAAAVAVAQRPDAGDVGRERVVDDDVAVFINVDPDAVEPEIVRVGLAADCQQYVRSGHGRVSRPCSPLRRGRPCRSGPG